MKPFSPAKMNMPPVRAFLTDMMRYGVQRTEAKQLYRKMREDKVWLNDVYQVNVSENPGLTHLSIKRIDRAPVHDWRDLQAIKNAICGPEREAVEVYPAESRKVDTANQYHLWVLPAGESVPFGFAVRAVTDAPGFNAVQRPGALADAVAIASNDDDAIDAKRYRKVRAARRFVGMVEFATELASTDADYDTAIDLLPVKS